MICLILNELEPQKIKVETLVSQGIDLSEKTEENARRLRFIGESMAHLSTRFLAESSRITQEIKK